MKFKIISGVYTHDEKNYLVGSTIELEQSETTDRHVDQGILEPLKENVSMKKDEIADYLIKNGVVFDPKQNKETLEAMMKSFNEITVDDLKQLLTEDKVEFKDDESKGSLFNKYNET